MLTERQIQVVNLIMKGKSNQEIADHLFVSVKTIKFHCWRIYKRLEVKTRGQLMAKMVQLSKKKT